MPLPVVARSGQPRTVFDKAPVVIVVRIRARLEIEEVDMEGGSADTLPLLSPPFWVACRAAIVAIVKVNERRQSDPDLSSRMLMVEQRDRGQRPIRFEFGRLYVLLLKPSPPMLGRPTSDPDIDIYSFAVPEGGLEIVNRRLVPLEPGGELEPYRGRPAEEVIAEIQSGAR